MADAVDLDRDLDELPGVEALPGAVGAQGQGRRALGPAVDGDDGGAALADHQDGADLFEVAVDAVRGGDRLEQREAIAPRCWLVIVPPPFAVVGGFTHDGNQRNIKCRHLKRCAALQ